MNKTLKEKINYVLLLIAILVVPSALHYYVRKENKEDFYEIVSLDHGHCRERAERDKVETRWCDEIKSASIENYRQAKNFDDFYLLLYFLPILFVLLVKVGNLSKQIAELKEKLDV